FLAPLGIQVTYEQLGIVLVLMFTGFPFVVRAVQPVLEELEPELEEAAATLGASRWQTFARVLWPPLIPAVLTGFSLALARALGGIGESPEGARYASPGQRPGASGAARWVLTLAAVDILGILIVVPVVHVFYQALAGGVRVYWDHLIGDPYARHAILLTLTVA